MKKAIVSNWIDCFTWSMLIIVGLGVCILVISQMIYHTTCKFEKAGGYLLVIVLTFAMVFLVTILVRETISNNKNLRELMK